MKEKTTGDPALKKQFIPWSLPHPNQKRIGLATMKELEKALTLIRDNSLTEDVFLVLAVKKVLQSMEKKGVFLTMLDDSVFTGRVKNAMEVAIDEIAQHMKDKWVKGN